MNILILNWRDPKNPFSGGAEKLNLEVLNPFMHRGDNIVWYAQSVEGLPNKEIINGIKIIRFGNAFTHFFSWPFFYWTKKFGKIDFIIDSIHGTGYLSPLFAPKVKKIILICEVAQNIWDEMHTFPVNGIGRVWEKVMFWFYKKNKFWTISQSTKSDLISFGIPSKNIKVLPMGFNVLPLRSIPAKYKHPTALFVGRLAEMKGVKDAIKAISEFNMNSSLKWSLNIIGRGEEKYESELKSLVFKLGMNKYISFLGYIGEKKKFEEMAKAWVLLVPSSREGWGMIVPEANYVGTLAVGYNVSGLKMVLPKYSDKNILVKSNSYKEISQVLLKIDHPVKLKRNLTPGWEELHQFVMGHLKYYNFI